MLGSSEHFVAPHEACSDTHLARTRAHPSGTLKRWRGALIGALIAATLVAAGCGDDGNGSGALVDSDAGGDEADVANNTVNNAPPDSGPPDAPEPECVADQDCDDGVFCNGVERCSEGECFASVQDRCSDTLECTRNSCDENNAQCVFVPDNSLCAPGQVCDLKAGCFTPSECVRDEDCDDGLLCNGAETCLNQTCQPGTPIDCDDGVSCSDDACVEEVGACQNVPNHALCLPGELCNLVEDCQPQPPCTRDDDCDDASFCNGVETCDLDTGECIPGEPPTLDDGIDCTIDTCSEELVMVLHTPSAARCTDGVFCNGAEVCNPVEGCLPGEPPVLSDGVGCTIDTCNEEGDFIEHTPDPSTCDDGLFCNGEEVCHPVDDCQPGEPVPLNDNVGCTVDTCSEVERAVLHVPSDELCDDALFCNGVETCDPEAGCQAGTAPTLDDDVGCTDDRCDEANDVVVHEPNDGLCDDGLFCNGDERCDPELDCQPGPPRAIDDDVVCTDDRCDEDNDVVVHEPNDGLCDDGLFCNGVETCDAVNDCLDGQPPLVDDNVPCTEAQCDEDNDVIVQTPIDALCDDQLICNGAETCDAQAGCIGGQAAEDGLVCGDDPRQICNKGDCEESFCGDLIVDEALGEECDGQDGCNENCRFGGDCPIGDGPVDFNGTFSALADTPIALSCALGLVSFEVNSLTFEVNNGDLRVTGAPVVMTQSPAPNNASFEVTGLIPAQGPGCDERYTLSGAFCESELRWEGAFSVEFLEPGSEDTPCNLGPLLGCLSTSWEPVVGRRFQ